MLSALKENMIPSPKEKMPQLASTSMLPLSVIPPKMTTLVIPSPFNKKIKSITKKELKPSNIKESYIQTSKANILNNIKDVLHIKEAFSSLSADEVGKMIKVKNSCGGRRSSKST